jgi:hypothetical protein
MRDLSGICRKLIGIDDEVYDVFFGIVPLLLKMAGQYL